MYLLFVFFFAVFYSLIVSYNDHVVVVYSLI
jgi:hypothetical protein